MCNFDLIYTVTMTEWFLQGNSFLLPLSNIFACMHQTYVLQTEISKLNEISKCLCH